jgi:hypothetical protein
MRLLYSYLYTIILFIIILIDITYDLEARMDSYGSNCISNYFIDSAWIIWFDINNSKFG